MDFARKVWKLLVAVKDGLVLLLMLMFFAALYAALSARPGPAAVQHGALLLELSGVVVEEPSNPDPLSLLLSQEAPMGEFRARDIVRALRAAASDDRINSVVLDLSGFIGGGFVHLQDIGDALDAVRAADKKVYAFGIAFLDDGMLLAAHCDEVWVDPNGGAFITGPGGNRIYFAGLLDKLRVKANVFRVGTFKSAVEPYLLDGPSEASLKAEEVLLGAIWEEWKADYAKSRPQVDLRRITTDPAGWLKESGGDPAQAAKSAGMVDRIGTRSEFNMRMVEISGENRRDKGLGKYAHTDLGAWLSAVPENQKGRAIGVVTVAGEIVDGDAGPGLAGSDRIVGVLEKALDKDLAGLVIRVDSPGGSLMASEHIRRAVLRFKEKRIPIVVSMGNVAASGGYWVSTPSSRIFAERGTITGSIGVFAVIPTFDEALAEFGVTGGGVKTTPLTGQPDLMTGLSPEVSSMFQSTIEHSYRKFITLVGQSRKLSVEDAADWAEGRPWAGGAARQLGLVDEFGGLDDALAYAAKAAKLEDGKWHAEYLGQDQTSPLATALGMLGPGNREQAQTGGDFLSAASARQHQLLGQLRKTLRNLLGTRGVQAFCLECPAVTSGRAESGEDPAADRILSGILELRGH
ncbi:MAG: signal peptide peptidase SppA [Sphingomonadaceae bacterium]|nr:signal peptide peptidase SppA [Sphingomonadaceae bacterium]